MKPRLMLCIKAVQAKQHHLVFVSTKSRFGNFLAFLTFLSFHWLISTMNVSNNYNTDTKKNANKNNAIMIK